MSGCSRFLLLKQSNCGKTGSCSQVLSYRCRSDFIICIVNIFLASWSWEFVGLRAQSSETLRLRAWRSYVQPGAFVLTLSSSLCRRWHESQNVACFFQFLQWFLKENCHKFQNKATWIHLNGNHSWFVGLISGIRFDKKSLQAFIFHQFKF